MRAEDPDQRVSAARGCKLNTGQRFSEPCLHVEELLPHWRHRHSELLSWAQACWDAHHLAAQARVKRRPSFDRVKWTGDLVAVRCRDHQVLPWLPIGWHQHRHELLLRSTAHARSLCRLARRRAETSRHARRRSWLLGGASDWLIIIFIFRDNLIAPRHLVPPMHSPTCQPSR